MNPVCMNCSVEMTEIPTKITAKIKKKLYIELQFDSEGQYWVVG